jgi:hypothetical protein
MCEEQLNKLLTNWVVFAVEIYLKASTIDEPCFIQSNDKGLNRLRLVHISRLVPQMVIILLPSNKKTMFVVLKNVTAYTVRNDL